MIPDIIRLLNSLCQLLFYRRITSHKCYRQGKSCGENRGSTVQLEKKRHWFKEYNYEVNIRKYVIVKFNFPMGFSVIEKKSKHSNH